MAAPAKKPSDMTTGNRRFIENFLRSNTGFGGR